MSQCIAKVIHQVAQRIGLFEAEHPRWPAACYKIIEALLEQEPDKRFLEREDDEPEQGIHHVGDNVNRLTSLVCRFDRLNVLQGTRCELKSVASGCRC